MNYTTKNRNTTGQVTLQATEREAGVTLLEFCVDFGEPTVPQPIEIRWEEPCVEMLACLRGNPGIRRTLNPNWGKQRSAARLASGAPTVTWLGNEGINRLTVTVSDAKTPTEICGGVIEENACLDCRVTFFTERIGAVSSYRAQILLDRRPARYEDALRAADRFWVAHGYPHAHVPDAARDAVYSCWYSFHQQVEPEAILAQCRLAKQLGMKTVIVDDGWQTDDNSRGYAFCGDWEVAPGKIPSMRALADAVHALGMKLVVWYSVPFVGTYTKAYGRFSDMLLGPAGRDFWALDPRYPAVREYLTGLYTDAVRTWDLDGFKLDFIDSFKLTDGTPPEDPRRDTESLEEGVDRLLAGVSAALRAIKPDILIEFRQTYFGPAVRKYGNMIRVADCPDDPLFNRVTGVDMRFLLGTVSVHSDMLMWHLQDSPEAVAYQMITVLPTVPQISVLLDRIPAKQREVLAFWLSFWQAHRDTLLSGELRADHPEALYSQVRMTKDRERVVIAYTDPAVTLPTFGSLYICNATGAENICLIGQGAPQTCRITVRDCRGRVTEERTETLCSGATLLSVPRCGLAELVLL